MLNLADYLTTRAATRHSALAGCREVTGARLACAEVSQEAGKCKPIIRYDSDPTLVQAVVCPTSGCSCSASASNAGAAAGGAGGGAAALAAASHPFVLRMH